MKERILAVLGAIALVAAAFAVRSVIAGDDGSGGGKGGDGGGGRPVVACTPDLMEVCDALAADDRIADDPPSLDLGDEAMTDPDIDGWITWDPAPGIVNIDDEGTWTATRAIGSSRLGVATRSGTAPNLTDGCDFASLDWSCVASAASPDVAVGVGTGATSESLARLYPIAAALVPDDADFTEILEADLDAVIRSPAVGQEWFSQQFTALRRAPGALNLLVGPLVLLRDPDGIEVSEPKPEADLVVVLAQREGTGLLSDAFDGDGVADALRAAGATPGTGSLAPEDRAGELYQVRAKVG